MKRLFLIAAFISFFSSFASAQTTAFNFQGRLNDGTTPANGRYDLQFRLFDSITGGNQIGSTVDRPNLMLVNGVFSTQLDFGSAAFPGSDRFIEISLRPTANAGATPNAYVILGARQQIMSVPYTIRSLSAANADHAANADYATTANNASSLGGTAATNYLQKNGDGSGLTNVTAVDSQKLGGTTAGQYVQKGSIGTVKAMLYVHYAGHILRCFNSTLSGSAAITPPCGFSENHFTVGGYGINFGFNIANTFVSITPINPSDQAFPEYATYFYPSQSPQNITVFIWDKNGDADNNDFSIIVY